MAAQDYYGTPERRRPWMPLVLLFAAFLLGGVGAVVAMRHWPAFDRLVHPQPAMPTDGAPKLRIVLPPSAAPSEQQLARRLATLEARVSDIDARAAEASGDADRAEGLLVAFAARRALDRAQPLGYIEGLLRERFGGTDPLAVAQIIAAAQRPVTIAQLQDELEVLRPVLVTHAPDEGWWRTVRTELGSLFVVRRAEQPSQVPADRMARAEHALDNGQVDAAAAEVARMPGATRAQDWMAQARRYTLARNALDRIETSALLAPPASPPPLVAPKP